MRVTGLFLLAAVLALPCRGQGLVNVARREFGTTAEASSVYGPGYEAEHALDGRTRVRETDKWNSALDVVPHWLRIDLGQPRTVRRIVIYHEWDNAASSDFRIQTALDEAGPYVDAIPPVKDNKDRVTTHDFAPVRARFVLLLLDEAEQDANRYGRIFEVEVYADEAEVEIAEDTRAEWLMLNAREAGLTPEEIARAAALMRHPDPFVRVPAEWALAACLGQGNNGERIVHPGPDDPPGTELWAGRTLADHIEADWVRQAVSLGIQRTPVSLRTSADDLLRRAGAAARDCRPDRAADIEAGLRRMQLTRDAMQASDDLPRLRSLWLDLRRDLRTIVLSGRDLDFDRILFCTRYAMHYKPNVCGVHTAWSYKPGGDLMVLEDLHGTPAAKPLLRGRLGPGHVHGLDLNFSARRIAFGWANQDRWPPGHPTSWPRPDNLCFAFELRNSTEPPHLYELDLDADAVSQLTDHDFWGDIEPVYCPDGSIAFTSDRSAHSPSCDDYANDLTDHNLYSLTPDRGAIRRLTNQKDVDMHPHLLDNGLIAYLRWEYQERHFWDVHAVWTVRPDGTMSDALFKQHLGAPVSVRDARSVPGTSQLVAIAAGHHTLPKGPVVLLDPSAGMNSPEGIRTVTVGPQPQERSETWRGADTGLSRIVPEGGVRDAGGFYMTPYALSERTFLVSYAYGSRPARKYGHFAADVDSNGAALYVIDVHGNRELLFRDPFLSALSPMPLRPRTPPPRLPDATDRRLNRAVCSVPNVYEGLEDVEPGTIRYIRIAEALPWPIVPGEGVKRWDLSTRWCPVRVIGTVPVAQDGSARFYVPIADNASVYFQALDENRMEIRRMRSSVSFQPGEERGCTGCHESRESSPSKARPAAVTREPVMPVPPPWGTVPLGFETLIRPILNDRCVSCHGPEKTEKGLDLSGPKAYETILRGHDDKGPLVSLSNRFSDGSVTKVKEFGSHRSRLVLALRDKHEKLQLTPDEWEALVTWVDANAPSRGDMLEKRTADGARDVWRDFPWHDPWGPPTDIPAR